MKQIFLLVFFSCFLAVGYSQTNPDKVSIYSEEEYQGLSFVYEDLAYPFYLELKPAWLEEHKPSVLNISKATSNGIIESNFAKIVIDRDSICRVTQITGYINNDPTIISKCTYEYDDLLGTIKLTEYSNSQGAGPLGEYIQYLDYYDVDDNNIKYDIVVYDLLNGWAFNNSFHVTLTEFDSCGNYKLKNSMSQFDNYDESIINTYIPNSCLLKHYSITKVSTGLEEYHYDYTYFPDSRLKSLKWINAFSGKCYIINYKYDVNNKPYSVEFGKCDSTDLALDCIYGWNNDNSLSSIDILPQMDTFHHINIEYGFCGNVSVKNFSENTNLSVKSPVITGEQLQISGLTDDNKYEFNMLDIQGHLLQTGQFTFLSTSNIKTEILAPGLYILSLRYRDKNWTLKFVKE
ncbi:MAG TPA: T9SS type A sorting domain-containing protein [Saprospiraceae bacterium]|nr:T9SS type A sorting domain-containing protein [Saprospiraceae bacterium]